MSPEDYTAKFDSEEDSPGWIAIDDACARVFGDAEPLGHFAPQLPPMLGGDGPDGISIYRGDGYLHYVTYGFTTLHYDEEAAGGEFSGYGFELTFKLKSEAPQGNLPMWPISVMQNLYKYVRGSGNWFEPNQAVPSVNSPINSDLSWEQSVISGLGFAEDPELGSIETPHGAAQFLLIVGLTLDEAKAIGAGETQVDDVLNTLRAADPRLVTDMSRGL